MSMLGRVTKGVQESPHLILLYGADGVGKSTFAAGAPNPIFLGTEKGTMNLDVARFPTPRNWEEVLAAVKELGEANHDFKTLVIDTLDWLEPIIYEHICDEYGTSSIEKAAGGYGKGYRDAFNEAVKLRDSLSFIREAKNMNIILLAHSKVTTFEDPATEHGYSRYELKLQESASVSMRAMWGEYVDSVLFCNFQTYSKGEGKGARGITTRERKMWTERDAAFDAKNRFGLPFEMELSYKAYDDAVKSKPNIEVDWETMRKACIDLLADCPEEKRKVIETAIEKAGQDALELKKVYNKIKATLGV